MSHIQRNATEVIDLTVHVYKLLKQIRVIIHTIKVNTWDQEGKQGKTPGKGKGEGWKKDVGDLFPDPRECPVTSDRMPQAPVYIRFTVSIAKLVLTNLHKTKTVSS